MNKRMEFPWEDDLSAAAFSLLRLPITYNFHPIKIVDGKLGNYETSAKLTFNDVNYIVDVCLNSTYSIFESGMFGEPPDLNDSLETIHYALAIEWLEAAET